MTRFDGLMAASCTAIALIDRLSTGSTHLDAVILGIAVAGFFKALREGKWNL